MADQKIIIMRKIFIPLLLSLFCVMASLPSNGQIIKKLKDKVAQAAAKKVGIDSTTTQADPGTTASQSGKPVNKGGAGLQNTPPPDVLQQITDAEQAHQSSKFSDARFSIQQALIGIEIQLGREILKSLPATVNNLPKDTMQDRVTSTQWGWSNMTIQRVYTDAKDKQVTLTIGNNSFYSGFVNMYFNNTYVEANANEQNVKQVKVKGHRSVIQYDDSKGYTLITPIGQSSMIVWECINYADETEVMNTANAFDIEGIMKMLGEQ